MKGSWARWIRCGAQAVCLAGGAAAAGWATYAWHPDRPVLWLSEEPLAEDEVTLATIEAWPADSFLWVDARAGAAHAEAHIPGALSLNESNWESQLFAHFDLLQQNRRVVVYCDQHACRASRVIAAKLREIGLTEVHVLREGWTAWRRAHP